MKIHALILALGGLVGATAVAQAQSAQLPPGPLESLQDDFGKIVKLNFEVPEPIVAASSGPGSPARALGQAFKTSLDVPGAVFAGILQPLAAADPMAPAPAPAAAPAAAPAPRHRRHARVARVHHPVPAQG